MECQVDWNLFAWTNSSHKTQFLNVKKAGKGQLWLWKWHGNKVKYEVFSMVLIKLGRISKWKENNSEFDQKSRIWGPVSN